MSVTNRPVDNQPMVPDENVQTRFAVTARGADSSEKCSLFVAHLSGEWSGGCFVVHP